MTEGHIKENLSFHYLGSIITRGGAKLERPFTDYGVDAVIEHIDKINSKYGTRYAASGISFDIQLKSTTKKGVTVTNKVIKYDLVTKNYNDLIRRSKNEIKHLEL